MNEISVEQKSSYRERRSIDPREWDIDPNKIHSAIVDSGKQESGEEWRTTNSHSLATCWSKIKFCSSLDSWHHRSVDRHTDDIWRKSQVTLFSRIHLVLLRYYDKLVLWNTALESASANDWRFSSHSSRKTIEHRIRRTTVSFPLFLFLWRARISTCHFRPCGSLQKREYVTGRRCAHHPFAVV